MALRSALELMDALDIGEVAQDFYFLRGHNERWTVHYRTPNKNDWRVSRADKLSTAIENALLDMQSNPYAGQEHAHGTHDITPKEDWEDLI